MKKILLGFIFTIHLITGCKSSESKNKLNENSNSSNNYTYVNNLLPSKIKVMGKWEKVDRKKDTIYFISHCPLVKNKDNAMLELWCKPNEVSRWRKKTNSEMLIKNLEFYLDIWTKDHSVELLETDDDKYAIYSIKNNLVERTTLIGYKNGRYYHLELFNDSYTIKQRTFLLLQVFNDN